MARAYAPEYLWLDQAGVAFGAPGHQPRWTSSEKDAVGTAYADSSRAWFTVSHGILNEIYFPTIDRPQTRDMEFLITDGETFFHEEKRDLEHEFAYIDSDALGVRIINRDREGRYSITKEIINDPHYPVVLIHTRLEAKPDILPRLKLYALHVSARGRRRGGQQRARGRGRGQAGAACMERRQLAGHGLRLRIQPRQLRVCGIERRMAGPEGQLHHGLAVWLRAERQRRGPGRNSAGKARVHRGAWIRRRSSCRAFRDHGRARHSV